MLYVEDMPAIMFRCPNTGRHVHEWFADDAEYGDDTYHSVTDRPRVPEQSVGGASVKREALVGLFPSTTLRSSAKTGRSAVASGGSFQGTPEQH
jgi:hypothetical protein